MGPISVAALMPDLSCGNQRFDERRDYGQAPQTTPPRRSSMTHENAMTFSRRNLMKIGAALAAVPMVSHLHIGPKDAKVLSTGSSNLDRSLGGGLRMGTVLAVVGPRGSGKSAFLLRLAKANGILGAYPIGTGTSDMLSITVREDGSHIGTLMLDAVEPSTDKERADMEQDPGAHDAFVTRWFARARRVMHDSGGLFAISVCEKIGGTTKPAWLEIPDYVIAVNQSASVLIKRL